MDEPSIKVAVNEEPVINCQFAPSEPGSLKADVEIERCEPVKIGSIIDVKEGEPRTIAETDSCMLESEDPNLVIAAKNKENEVCTDFNKEELKSAATRVYDVVDSIVEEEELRTVAESDNCVLVPEPDDQNTVIAVKNKDENVFTDVNVDEHLPNLENSIHAVFNSKDGNFGVTDVKTKDNSFATGSQLGNVDAVVEEAYTEIYELKDTQLLAEVAKEGNVENKIVEETQKGENEDKEYNVDGIVEEVVEEAHVEAYEPQESKLIKGVVKDANVENMFVEEQERTTTKKNEDEDMVSKEQETLIANTEMETETEVVRASGRKRKRGGRVSNIEDRKTTRKTIGEDVCFICYDGGDLVLCDRKRCPKAYHPPCVNTNDAFFQSKGSWNCVWHMCSMCEEDAHHMCYTCTYSLCKRCMTDGAISRVRGSKGFCETCIKTVMLIERNESGNGETAKVDFDEKSSLEYLFKDYWSGLKGKLSLSFEEHIQAKKIRKRSDVALENKPGSPGGSEDGSGSGIPSGNKTCTLLKRKAKKRIKALTKEETSAGASDVALRDKQESHVKLYDANGGSGLDIPSGNKTSTPTKRKANKRLKALTEEETSASASDVALGDKHGFPVKLNDANGGSGLDIPLGNKTNTPIKRKATKRTKALSKEATSASASDVALGDRQGSAVELYDASRDGPGLGIPSENKTNTPVKRKVKNQKNAPIKKEISTSASDAALRDKHGYPVELYNANGDGSGSDIPSRNKTATPLTRKDKKRIKDLTKEKITASASENLNSSNSKRAKGKKRLKLSAELDSPCGVSAVSVEETSMFGKSGWASKEVLDFVMHMKDGDTSVLAHSEVQGLLFKYIKQNKLRDPCRKNQIICDSTLQNLFGKHRVGHFEMQKILESHFLSRQNSQTYEREGTVNTETCQLDVKDRKLKAPRKGDGRALQSNVDDYAAIDTNNINLVYLRRNVMEALLDDSEYFHRKVVGCFVRIRILGDNQKQEMYRLVQVVGTRKADTSYYVVKRTTDIMLEVQNLNNKEDIPIDIISNQQFTEDECYRLRQSIKCGLVNRLTLGDILEKVIALQEVRDNDWLVAEVERLSYLCDRANDTGRQRRLKKIPKVHPDLNMDPDHESEGDEGKLDSKKQDIYMTPTGNDSSKKELGPISPHKGSYVSNYSCNVIRNSSNTMELRGNIFNKTEDTAVTGDLVNENTLAQAKATAKFNDTGKMWLYQDPSGKVQGPFSKAQLRKWSSTGYFPKDLRIWNSSDNQDDSILLTFALDRGFEKVIENGFSNCQGTHSSHSSSYSGKIESSKGSLGMSVKAMRFGTTGSNSDISNLPSPPSLSRGFESSSASHSTLTRETNIEYNETGVLAPPPYPGPDSDTVSVNHSIQSNGWSYGSVNTQMVVELNNQAPVPVQQPIYSQWSNAASSSVHNSASSLPSGPVNQANVQPSGLYNWAQGSNESVNTGSIIGLEFDTGWGSRPGILNTYFGVTAPGNMNIPAPGTGNLWARADQRLQPANDSLNLAIPTTGNTYQGWAPSGKGPPPSNANPAWFVSEPGPGPALELGAGFHQAKGHHRECESQLGGNWKP